MPTVSLITVAGSPWHFKRLKAVIASAFSLECPKGEF